VVEGGASFLRGGPPCGFRVRGGVHHLWSWGRCRRRNGHPARHQARNHSPYFASRGQFCLHDTKPETIRLTLRVGDNFEETPEFYQQLSRLNSGKSGIKFWSEEGTLVACEDVPCYRFDDAPAAAEHLQREMVDLGVVLAAGSTLF